LKSKRGFSKLNPQSVRQRLVSIVTDGKFSRRDHFGPSLNWDDEKLYFLKRLEMDGAANYLKEARTALSPL
jgi:hypothetical protein